MRSRSLSRKCNFRLFRRSGFTLVELVVALAVLSLLLVSLALLLQQTQEAWKRVSIGNFSEAEDALAWIVPRLAGATLQPTWDYADANGNFSDAEGTFHPDHLALRSSTAFTCDENATLFPNSGILGSAIFFTAPLGYTESQRHQGLNRLQNEEAIFVDYAPESNQPGWLSSPRWRFRLKETSCPAEQPGALSKQSSRQLGQTSTAHRTTTLADNVLAFIVLVQPSMQYSYDSRTNATGLDNQLPPKLRVVLIALDEGAGTRLAAQWGERTPILLPRTLLQNGAALDADLAQIDLLLSQQHLAHPHFLPHLFATQCRRRRGTLKQRRQVARRGSVLLITLLTFALVFLLTITLLEQTTHQTRGAESRAVQTRLRFAADSAVALVINQIHNASTQVGQAWISQPGLVRTFGAGSRLPTACYKLYSAPTLIDRSQNLNFLATDVPDDWAARSSEYVDLNKPLTGSGFLARPLYPIFNPALLGEVQGVRLDAPHGAEMPVAWLYQLQDGTLGAASQATVGNPIVARLAFWADDETSKINLNTAGAGQVWSSPQANAEDDKAAAANRPTAAQVWEDAGHPATTSLAPLFANDAMSIDALLALTPRYGGTARSFYSAVEDWLFQPLPLTEKSGTRVLNSGLNATLVQHASFVATVRSLAPETTLLDEPRIALWPTSETVNSTHLTIWDRAVRAAASVHGTAYYLTRAQSQNGTDDLALLPRNQALLEELIARGERTLPGVPNGATFAQKYPGAQWPQLVLECLDYIHGLNALDPTDAAQGLGRGFVAPLQTIRNGVTLRGFGRCPTLQNLTLICYASGYGFNDLPPGKDTFDLNGKSDADAKAIWQKFFATPARWNHINRVVMRAFIVPCTFLPEAGFPEVIEPCRIKIQGLDKLEASGQNFDFPAEATSLPLGSAARTLDWGGGEGPLAWQAAAQNPATPYPFSGAKAAVLPIGTWTCSGTSNLQVQIISSQGVVLQTAHVDLPSFPVPKTSQTQPCPNTIGEFLKAPGDRAVGPWFYMNLANRLQTATDPKYRQYLIQAGDVVRSVEANSDLRVQAALADVPASFFSPHPQYGKTKPGFSPATGLFAHHLFFSNGTSACFATGSSALLPLVSFSSDTQSDIVHDAVTGASIPYSWTITPPLNLPLDFTGQAGDWATGPALMPDGSLIPLPDAGTQTPGANAYFSWTPELTGTTRTPNAQVASPLILGALPSGIDPAQPQSSKQWQTLLFCANPARGWAAHPGSVAPMDPLLLDQFWMPVVEPWPISQRFVTAGKVNLNAALAPFSWLHRETALRAVLASVKIPAISITAGGSYKSATAPALAALRRPLDVDATVALITQQDTYLSESEICAVPLLPQGIAQADLQTFWNSPIGAGRLTGMNLREQPYAELYSRLTTRSNSFLVHVWVQTLKKIGHDSPPNIWREDADLITGQWRGSYEVERYLDPVATAPTSGEKLGPYRFRVLSAVRFGP